MPSRHGHGRPSGGGDSPAKASRRAVCRAALGSFSTEPPARLHRVPPRPAPLPDSRRGPDSRQGPDSRTGTGSTNGSGLMTETGSRAATRRPGRRPGAGRHGPARTRRRAVPRPGGPSPGRSDRPGPASRATRPTRLGSCLSAGGAARQPQGPLAGGRPWCAGGALGRARLRTLRYVADMGTDVDAFLRRLAQALRPRANQSADVLLRVLRAELPEMWKDDELSMVALEETAGHVTAFLDMLEHGLDVSEVETPASAPEVARDIRPARRTGQYTPAGLPPRACEPAPDDPARGHTAHRRLGADQRGGDAADRDGFRVRRPRFGAGRRRLPGGTRPAAAAAAPARRTRRAGGSAPPSTPPAPRGSWRRSARTTSPTW
ncbi:hypothetical protein SGLAM104S_01864 [Streptomyces glaucescens]